ERWRVKLPGAVVFSDRESSGKLPVVTLLAAPIQARKFDPGRLSMSTDKPRPLVRLEYAKAADAYLHSLPLEHFMETTAQATQRQITLESLDLVHACRNDVQVFNELLVQYPYGRGQRLRQVVPDNMVVVHDQPIQADTSYDMPLQPVGPFWVLEY